MEPPPVYMKMLHSGVFLSCFRMPTRLYTMFVEEFFACSDPVSRVATVCVYFQDTSFVVLHIEVSPAY